MAAIKKPRKPKYPKRPKAKASISAWEQWEEKCKKIAKEYNVKLDAYYSRIWAKDKIIKQKHDIALRVNKAKEYKPKRKAA